VPGKLSVKVAAVKHVKSMLHAPVWGLFLLPTPPDQLRQALFLKRFIHTHAVSNCLSFITVVL
jgi:hypothetical protein